MSGKLAVGKGSTDVLCYVTRPGGSEDKSEHRGCKQKSHIIRADRQTGTTIRAESAKVLTKCIKLIYLELNSVF